MALKRILQEKLQCTRYQTSVLYLTLRFCYLLANFREITKVSFYFTLDPPLKIFTFNHRKKCFLFQVIHGKNPDKDSRMQVSNDFRIITWNWVGISKTLMEN